MSFVVDEISHQFANGGVPVRALDRVSFSADSEEFLSLVGPSGCGKSTLLRVIAGLLQPTSGTVLFGDTDPPGSLRTALVFQEHGLLPWCTVLENVALGLEFLGTPRDERERRARAFLQQTGLEAFASAFPSTLSVGMRQRVALARAFVADPQILLLDEPFGALDAQTRLVMQEELLRIWREHRKLVVHVTHDIEEAIMLGDRVLVMSGRPGTVLEELVVPLPRPRRPADLERDEVVTMRARIWRILRDEVRASLGLDQGDRDAV